MDNEFQNETFDEVITYRNVSVQIWNDDYGQQKFARFINDPLFGTQDIGFGSFNCDFQSDLEALIDDKLDTIERFPEYGGKLQWFENGYQYRDLRLFFRSRLVKVWLVENPDKVNMDDIKKESIDILAKLERFRLSKKADEK